MRSTESKRSCNADLAGRSTSEQGFTLIETTAAMLIMMIAGLGVVSLFTYSIAYNTGGNDRAVAISVAQQQVEQLRSVSFTDPILNVSTTSGSPTNTVSNGRTYRVTQTVTGSNNDVNGNPTLKMITIQVSPVGAGWTGLPVVLQTMRSATTKGTH